ncbi:MAG TPA: hypothetical protein VGJ86_21255 [Acidimicrobiales bacterium]
MSINHTPTRRPQPVPSTGWWDAAFWIPVGFASSRCLGAGAPWLAVVFLTAALAGAHWFFPGIVESTVGTCGLLASVFAAADGRACGAVLGSGGIAVIQFFGGVMLLSGLIRLLGSGNLREMGRHLLVATAALQLGLFVLSPIGQAIIPAQSQLTVPVTLLTILFLTTLVGIRSRRRGPRLLGVGLVGVLCLQAVTGSPCAVSPMVGLAASLTFAGVALILGNLEDDDYALAGTQPRPNQPHLV